jgi:hypothetical protein
MALGSGLRAIGDRGFFLPGATGPVAVRSRIGAGQFPASRPWFFLERHASGDGTGCFTTRGRRLWFGGVFGERALDEEQGLGSDGHGSQLASGRHAVKDFANARARGERREENLGFLRGRSYGGAEIDGEQRGERGGLGGIAAGGELFGEAVFQEGPAGGLAQRVNRCGAEGGPELNESAEDGGFSEFAAEDLTEFDGGFFAFTVEGLPGAEDDGSVAGVGRGLPLAVAADGGGPRQNVGGDEEIGLLGEGSEKIEGDDAALGDKAGGELRGQSDGGGGRGDAGCSEAGLNEGRSGRGKLGMARQKQAEADVVEPARGIVEGQQRGRRIRCGGLVPQRSTRDL